MFLMQYMSEDFEEPPDSRSLGKYRDRIVNGPIIRTLVWLGVPPLINQLTVVAYNVADAYWLSLYSETTVAVPRQTWPVIMLFQALVMALTAASLSIVSQYIGGKSYREASLSASRFFTLSFFCGAVLCVTLLTLRGLIFAVVISTPPEIFEDVMKYSSVISFDIFLNYISLIFTTLLQSIGDTRRPAIVNTLAVSLNVLLDPFLVLGLGPFPRLGVVGAAITDVMGKMISAGALAYMLRKYYPELRVFFTKDIDFKWIALVMRIGLPVLALGATNGFAFLFQLWIINQFGVTVATAYAIGFLIMDIVDAVLWGLSGATAIMVGQNIGAENYGRAKEVAYKSALLLFTLVALGACLVYPIRSSLVDIFADDPEIMAETDRFLQILVPTLPFFGLFMVGMSTGRGSGHTVFPTTVGVFRLWGIRVALGYVLAFNFRMGSIGAWLAISLSNIIGGALALLWIKYGNWTEKVVERKTGV